MTLIRVRRAAQITLPLEIRQAIHLEEGDYLEVQVTDNGILLRPVDSGRREPTLKQEAESWLWLIRKEKLMPQSVVVDTLVLVTCDQRSSASLLL